MPTVPLALGRQIYDIPEEHVEEAVGSGRYSRVSDQELQAWDTKQNYKATRSSVGQSVDAFAIGATTQVLGVPALLANMLPGVSNQSGSQWLANAASWGADMSTQEAEDAIRAIAQISPNSHMGGQILGSVLGTKGAGMIGKQAAKLGAQAAPQLTQKGAAALAGRGTITQAAVKGTPMALHSAVDSIAFANEMAFVHSRELSAETIGMAGLLGGLSPFAIPALVGGARWTARQVDKGRSKAAVELFQAETKIHADQVGKRAGRETKAQTKFDAKEATAQKAHETRVAREAKAQKKHDAEEAKAQTKYEKAVVARDNVIKKGRDKVDKDYDKAVTARGRAVDKVDKDYAKNLATHERGVAKAHKDWLATQRQREASMWKKQREDMGAAARSMSGGERKVANAKRGVETAESIVESADAAVAAGGKGHIFTKHPGARGRSVDASKRAERAVTPEKAREKLAKAREKLKKLEGTKEAAEPAPAGVGSRVPGHRYPEWPGDARMFDPAPVPAKPPVRGKYPDATDAPVRETIDPRVPGASRIPEDAVPPMATTGEVSFKVADLISPDQATRQTAFKAAAQATTTDFATKSIAARAAKALRSQAKPAGQPALMPRHGFGFILGGSLDGLFGAAMGGGASVIINKFGPMASGIVMNRVKATLAWMGKDAAKSALSSTTRDVIRVGRGLAASIPGAAYRSRLAFTSKEAEQAIQKLAGNPVEMMNEIGDAYGSYNDADKERKIVTAVTLQHFAALEFLKSKIPASRPMRAAMPHAGRMNAPIAEQEKFMRTVNAVSDPMTLYRELATGQVSRETVEAVRAVYPSMYLEMVQAVLGELSQHETPLTRRQESVFDMFLGGQGAIAAAANPKFMARLEQSATETGNVEEQEQGGGGGGGGKPGRNTGSPTMSQQHKTLSQSATENIGN